MALVSDTIRAKRELSKRLLRAGLESRVIAAGRSLRVSTAVESARSNVHAVGAGMKVVNGHTTNSQCVRLYVTQKLAPSLLSAETLLPTDVDGVPTDIIEAAPAFLQQAPACSVNRQNRQRPVVAGISAGHHSVTAGTIGCFCRSTRAGDDAGDVYALSNNHVFADVNNASPGDDLLQPGTADGGTRKDHFADFARAVQIDLSGTTPNAVDAAIGKLLKGTQFRPVICTIGAITGHMPAEENMLVRKHGRTTGYTEGIVTDESYDALVGMDHNNPAVVGLFEDQFRIARIPPYPAIGLGGDSGSLVVHQDRADAIGLYFAGPANGSYGIANHIADVLNELEIAII